MRRLSIVGLSVFLIALLAARASSMQVRSALAVSIAGVQVPVASQPRVIVEQQPGMEDRARVRVAGPIGVAYAQTVAPGDAVEIVATALGGLSTTVFRGAVTSIEPGVGGEPSAVIHASGAVPGEQPAASAVRIARGLAADARLVDFTPSLSARSSVQGVLVTGLLDSTGEPITGRALAPGIPLVPDSGEWSGATVIVNTERRFASVEAANVFAQEVLADLLAARISAEALTEGIAGLKVNSPVEVAGMGTPFDGTYYVTGVKHQFGGDSYGGYSTSLRLRRADLGMFHHPEIDDEVLVAFEAGDPLRAYVVESLWECESSGREETPDDSRCRRIRWPW